MPTQAVLNPHVIEELGGVFVGLPCPPESIQERGHSKGWMFSLGPCPCCCPCPSMLAQKGGSPPGLPAGGGIGVCITNLCS